MSLVFQSIDANLLLGVRRKAILVARSLGVAGAASERISIVFQ